MVVLPIKPSGENFVMITKEHAKKEGWSHLAEWLNNCESEWQKRRQGKASKQTLLQWLNYRNKITQQRHTAKYKVPYPMSATYLCAAVAENQKIIKKIGGQKITLNNFIADYVTFFAETESKNEAYYLTSFLNSPTLDALLKPMQAKGLWGPRHICMKVWELPIPIYKEEKREHRELAQLGIDCAEKVKKFLPELITTDITPSKIGRLRNEVRERLSDELKEIDVIVKRVMGK